MELHLKNLAYTTLKDHGLHFPFNGDTQKKTKAKEVDDKMMSKRPPPKKQELKNQIKRSRYKKRQRMNMGTKKDNRNTNTKPKARVDMTAI